VRRRHSISNSRKNSIRQSAELEFVSGGGDDCYGSKLPKRVGRIVRPGAIKDQEDQRYNLRLVDLQLLQSYADAISKLVKANSDVSAELDQINAIFSGATKLAGSAGSDVLKNDATAVAATASAIITAIKGINTASLEFNLQQAAIKVKPKLVAAVARLKQGFHIVNDDTQKFINMWYWCADRKFTYMRNNSPQVMARSSVTDFDASYGAFQAQYRQFLNNMPSINNSLLDKVVDANQKLIDADLANVAFTATQFATTIDQIVSAYKSAKASAAVITKS
jgi:hypothetical protein